MIFRTTEQKADLRGSFYRPDRPFFAAGACHILAQAFLESVESDEWKASLIVPHPGFRGTHVFACNERYAFDYHGYTPICRFLDHYFKKMNRRYPDWAADILDLEISPTGEEFCTLYGHRMPEQFYADPRPRANLYVRRFKLPDDAW